MNNLLKRGGYTPYYYSDLELLYQFIKYKIKNFHPFKTDGESSSFEDIEDSIQLSVIDNVKTIKRMLKNTNGKIIVNDVSYENPVLYKLHMLVGLRTNDLSIINSAENINQINIHSDIEVIVEYIFMLDSDLNIQTLVFDYPSYEYKQTKNVEENNVRMKFQHKYINNTRSFNGKVVPLTSDLIINNIQKYGPLIKYAGVNISTEVTVESYNHLENAVPDPNKLDMYMNQYFKVTGLF